MLIIPPPKFRRRRRLLESSVAASPPPPPPAALALVSAAYDQIGPTVTLVFDRAVNIDAFDGTQIIVQDQINGWLLQGDSAWLIDPVTVGVNLDQIDSSSGFAVLLDATAATGIVAVDDGGTWAGCTDLGLPFP